MAFATANAARSAAASLTSGRLSPSRTAIPVRTAPSSATVSTSTRVVGKRAYHLLREDNDIAACAGVKRFLDRADGSERGDNLDTGLVSQGRRQRFDDSFRSAGAQQSQPATGLLRFHRDVQPQFVGL